MMKLNIHVITLFPDYFTSPLQSSLLGKAINLKLIDVNIINLRDFAINKYGQVDDTPYGGGHGMVLMIEPLKKALESIKETSYKILLTPRGFLWNQQKCLETYNFLKHENRGGENKSITLICGHYEGVDERIVEFIDESICIGDYILSGGESAALVLIDTLSRLIPGFMGNAESLTEESFNKNEYIEYPQYTKPSDFEGLKVPDILVSGHHARIKEWRHQKSIDAYQKFRKVFEKQD
ncbi:MAG: tRNA (guanosine(37)-N1)-methyltransferase TrmD [Spirochaetia bacterium]|nr:tRNA (guanosine(37)-N1)-methyltransferase TrmD [Spirochaetia bacterium]